MTQQLTEIIPSSLLVIIRSIGQKATCNFIHENFAAVICTFPAIPPHINRKKYMFTHLFTNLYIGPEWLSENSNNTKACLQHRPQWHCTNRLPQTLLMVIEWVSSVVRPHQHSIGYTGDGFYRSEDPTNSIKVLKEMLQKRKKTTKTTKCTYT